MNRAYVAVAELVLAGMIWGFGFIATIWALESYSPIGMSIVRFFLATVLGFFLILAFPKWKKSLNKQQIMLASLPGALLGTLMIFQTWGLEFTSATNSSFITTLYVVLVPLYQVLLLRKRLHPMHGLFVMMGLIGTAFIMNLQWSGLNRGDILTLGCANFAALHIIVIDRIQKQISAPFTFNVLQSFWAGAISLIFMPLMKGPHVLIQKPRPVLGLLFLVLFSTLTGFFLQVRAQKVLSPALSSILFLLEAPFALIFAVLILNEHLSALQLAGALLILSAAVGAVRLEAPTKPMAQTT